MTYYTLTYYARASVMEIKFEDASPDKNDTAVLPDGISIVDATAPITVTTTTTGMVRAIGNGGFESSSGAHCYTPQES